MTSTLKDKPAVVKPKFPVLMQNKSERFVVLFTGLDTGVIVHTQPPYTHTIGYRSTGWINYDDTSEWEPFKGELILSN